MSTLTPAPTWFRLDDLSTVGSVRRFATELAVSVDFAAHKVGDFAIIVSELATNLVKHAQDGALLVRPVRGDDTVGVEVISIDAAPGMADFAAMYEDGRSTTGTLGIGLGAVARLADRSEGFSMPGRGSVLCAQLWHEPPPPRPWAEGLTRPLTGETVSGDAYASRTVAGRRLVMVSDGLGHGPLAAAASQAALQLFHTAPDEPLPRLMERLHRGLSHTRGAAVALAEIDFDAGVVRVCGLGNIASSLVTGDERRNLISMPGITGHGKATIRQFEHPYSDDSLLIMHSDGVTDKWTLHPYPGLVTRSPLLVAATVLRDAGVRRDDACVLVAGTRP
ncbi:SpoIIE family protein phosphatase [Catellatospora sp. NEAU-YM18]|nr:SpoIIE family protein phosphatase [Catellatospora tritici]MBV1856519.1 SpoIIE family protein phosphatase [Catellatospora tritici]